VNTALSDYIAAAKARGATDSFLVELLERNGWPRKEVYAAFASIYETPKRGAGFAESARDAFLYLLSFGTLSTWAWALGTLFFTLIDIWYRDSVFTQQPYMGRNFAISSSMAALVVSFPIYLATMRILLRDISRKPEKLESGVRKWLTYIALLISASVVIGDLITTVDYFLRGEITTRFVLKVLTVLVIAGGVFLYYVQPLEKPEEQS
jgi:hypothetical protein